MKTSLEREHRSPMLPVQRRVQVTQKASSMKDGSYTSMSLEKEATFTLKEIILKKKITVVIMNL